MFHYFDFTEFIDVFVPDSLEDILAWRNQTNLSNNSVWIFRGQGDSNWALSPTLERFHQTIQRQKNVIRNIIKLEDKILDLFIPPVERYVGKKFINRVEKFSILQHYGINTRLLDFSKNLDVALFFAVNNKQSPFCVVYALDFSIMSLVTALRTNYSKNREVRLNIQNIYDPSLMNKYFKKNNKYDDEVLLINPYIESERIKTQEGCFLMPSNINLTFSANLRNSLNRTCGNDISPIFFKFLINEKVSIEISRYLENKKINHTGLFPEEKSGLQEFIDKLKLKINI